jgi:uncharacterized protein (DUF4415 family)
MSRIESINPADLVLTATDLAELRQVAQLSDSTIDYSDIPPSSEADWCGAVSGRLYRPLKKQVTLRLDADVLAWARKKSARGYQSRLNAILRDAMIRDLNSNRQRA